MLDWSSWEFFILFLPRNMASHWVSWIIVEKKKLNLNSICLKLPRKLCIKALQRQYLPLWPGYFLLTVRTATAWACYYYSLGQCLARNLGFQWDITQDLDQTNCHRGQYYLVQQFVSRVAHDMSNLGVLCLTSWIELWKNHHQTSHEIEVKYGQFLDL